MAGFAMDVQRSAHFHFDWNINYHFVKKFGEVIFGGFGLAPTEMDYSGFNTGPSLYIGKRSQFEFTTLFGGGFMVDPESTRRIPAMEIINQFGYRYVSKYGITIKVGASSLSGRNEFWSPMFSGYMSLGYAFQKSKGVQTISKHKNPYVALSINPFLVNTSGSLIGISLMFDHVFYNGSVADVGYSISGRVGAPWDDDLQYGVSPSILVLIGSTYSQFELTTGPNFPFGSNGFPNPEWYTLIQYGLGYRFSLPEQHFLFRIGIASTGALQAGLGLSLGGNR